MKQELVISSDEWETRCAVLEDGKAVEIYYERAGERLGVGSIYLGRVSDVLPGMEAAFIDIGKERNAFLFYGHEAYYIADGSEALPLDVLKRGQQLFVQVSKEPFGEKGARVSSQISLAGRYLVLVPFGRGVALSRKLTDKQRETLTRLGRIIQPEGMGLIVRTAAVEGSEEQIRAELDELVRRWSDIGGMTKRKKAPALLHADASMPGRLIRDVVSADFENVYVDSGEVAEEVKAYFANKAPVLAGRVRLELKEPALFERFGIDASIKEALKREVRLASGGKIGIDQTEALTAIDVNTGRYVGKGSLEDTVLKVNLEAAAEIVRQIRLRDIGGIIVVDFIDMRKASHRQLLYDAFTSALERDRVKSQVVEISKMGLIEMTRKKTAEDLPALLSERCPTCSGTGRVMSGESRVIDTLRRIRQMARTSTEDSIEVVVHPDVAERLGRQRKTGEWLDEATGKRVRFRADDALSLEDVRVVEERRSRAQRQVRSREQR